MANEPELENSAEEEDQQTTEGEESSEGENRIPHSRVKEMVAVERRRTEAVQAQLREMQIAQARMEGRLQATPAQQPKVFTRAELTNHVNEGTISQVQMDEVLDRQAQTALDARVDAKVAEVMSTQQQIRSVNDTIALYKKHIPDVTQPGSEARAKVEVEYNLLRQQGQPDTIGTEAMALRMAYGDPDLLAKTTPTKRETHSEGGTNSQDTSTNGSKGGPPKGMDKWKVDFYQDQIDKGRLKDWADVRETEKYARK